MEPFEGTKGEYIGKGISTLKGGRAKVYIYYLFQSHNMFSY